MSPGITSTDVSPTAHLVDPFDRPVKSLRLSLTQKCNLDCFHCHREGQTPSADEMSPSEIERIVAVGASLGIRKVKLTGGEPLLRGDVCEIVSRISPMVSEVSLTTNGIKLASLADSLKCAGLSRVNVSLHTLDPGRYMRLFGVDVAGDVLKGISSAVIAGLMPVKVNMVVFKDENQDEILPMMEFCQKVGAVLQLIEYETDREGANGCRFKSAFHSLESVERMLAADALDMSVNELHRRNRYVIRANGGEVMVEVVRPMHNTVFCQNCTRIRLSSDGHLKPCLLDSSGEIDILTPLRGGATDGELRELFIRAVRNRRPYWS